MTGPLPDRMREAAKTLREADERRSGHRTVYEYAWQPRELEAAADRFEAEDRAKAEREAMAEELATFMVAVQADNYPGRADLRDPECTKARGDALEIARRLIADGWTKRAQS